VTPTRPSRLTSSHFCPPSMLSSLILLPLFTLTSALSLSPRQSSTQLLAQISELSTSVTQLTSAVNSFDGSLLGVLPQGLGVITAEKDVDARVLKATRTAQDSSAFTAPESRDVLVALAGQIDPIKGSLEALKGKVCTERQRGRGGTDVMYRSTLSSRGRSRRRLCCWTLRS
jgi:hypothetical protein